MIRRGSLLLATVLLTLAVGTTPSHAAGYRYWSFWDRDGNRWTYATQGPSTARPSDGDVQGFRFAVSEDSSDATRPRGDTTFTMICAKTPARDDRKRIALVIDFGTAKDAPSGETPPAPRTACAVVPQDATTAEALASVVKPLRYDSSALLCAIGGYPQKGCGEQVTGKKNPAPADKKDTTNEGPSVGVWAGAAVVAALGAAAIWQTRRHRHG
ncbi:SCO2322 family protein [Streptomyces sp. NPDC048751]|uniref:SCO2322 family protein n=1 Tax=Streptomyces sp. NPDC048751 TaxID=3365591 RepID=UPI00371E72D2